MMLQKLLRDICKEEKNLKHVNSTYLSPSEANPARHDFDTSETDKSKQEEVGDRGEFGFQGFGGLMLTH